MNDRIENRLTRLGNQIDADEMFVDAVMDRVSGRAMEHPRQAGSGGWVGLAAAAVVLLGLGVWMGVAIAERGYVGPGRVTEQAGIEPERVMPVAASGSPKRWIENLLSLRCGQAGDAIVGVVVAVPQQWPSDSGIVLILSSARPSDATLQAFGTPMFAAQFTRQELFDALNKPAATRAFDDEPFEMLTAAATPAAPLTELIARLSRPADPMQSPTDRAFRWD